MGSMGVMGRRGSPPPRAPGDTDEYSNLAMGLLGHALLRALASDGGGEAAEATTDEHP